MIATLERVDAALFREAECWFGGGSAVALRCGEHRVSRDVDFLCASREGYRRLREVVHTRGAAGLFDADVQVVREVRADRYGIRTAIEVDGAPMKIEIVSEGRVDVAGVDDVALPVARLSDLDLVAEKLLANDDRFLDDSALGRDVIDLIALERALGGLPEGAWEKARVAYGASVDRSWERSLRRLAADPMRRARWFDAMDVSADARAWIEARVAPFAVTEG